MGLHIKDYMWNILQGQFMVFPIQCNIIFNILNKFRFNVIWCVNNFFGVIKIGISHIINNGLGVYNQAMYNINKNIGIIAILKGLLKVKKRWLSVFNFF